MAGFAWQCLEPPRAHYRRTVGGGWRATATEDGRGGERIPGMRRSEGEEVGSETIAPAGEVAHAEEGGTGRRRLPSQVGRAEWWCSRGRSDGRVGLHRASVAVRKKRNRNNNKIKKDRLWWGRGRSGSGKREGQKQARSPALRFSRGKGPPSEVNDVNFSVAGPDGWLISGEGKVWFGKYRCERGCVGGWGGVDRDWRWRGRGRLGGVGRAGAKASGCGWCWCASGVGVGRRHHPAATRPCPCLLVWAQWPCSPRTGSCRRLRDVLCASPQHPADRHPVLPARFPDRLGEGRRYYPSDVGPA